VVEFPDGEQVSVQGETVQVVEQARSFSPGQVPGP
jgi:hypothetical protein